jgi:hypothetical protein
MAVVAPVVQAEIPALPVMAATVGMAPARTPTAPSAVTVVIPALREPVAPVVRPELAARVGRRALPGRVEPRRPAARPVTAVPVPIPPPPVWRAAMVLPVVTAVWSVMAV